MVGTARGAVRSVFRVTSRAPNLHGGRRFLHVAITNHRSRREDFELLVRETVRLGDELASGPSTG